VTYPESKIHNCRRDSDKVEMRAELTATLFTLDCVHRCNT